MRSKPAKIVALTVLLINLFGLINLLLAIPVFMPQGELVFNDYISGLDILFFFLAISSIYLLITKLVLSKNETNRFLLVSLAFLSVIFSIYSAANGYFNLSYFSNNNSDCRYIEGDGGIVGETGKNFEVCR